MTSSGAVSTKKLLAMKALERVCGAECVAWAIGQLEKGATDRHLLMLAGMTPPFNHFEMAALRDRVLSNLGIEDIGPPEALRILAAELAADAVSGRTELLAALAEISQLFIEADRPRDLNDFDLLYEAWDDLLTQNQQWYWRGATRENIAEIARIRLEQFVDEASAAGLLERD